MKHRSSLSIAVAGALIAALSVVANPAVAAPLVTTPPELLIGRTEVILDAFPGGVELGPGIIAWDEGATVLTLDGAMSPQAIATCATGQYCAWSATGYTGTKLAFTACSAGGTSNSLALLSGLARSTANARTSGRVDAVSGSSVIYSMAANTGRAANGSRLSALVCYT